MDFGFLLCHGCGYPLSFGCANYGTDWHVEHLGDIVLLSDAYFGSHRIVPEVKAHVSLGVYRREIVKFAREAREFYFTIGPRPSDMPDLHQEFWAEFDERLARAEALAGES